jgi:hypothetical protein
MLSAYIMMLWKQIILLICQLFNALMPLF